jgi:hypothetical protein
MTPSPTSSRHAAGRTELHPWLPSGRLPERRRVGPTRRASAAVMVSGFSHSQACRPEGRGARSQNASGVGRTDINGIHVGRRARQGVVVECQRQRFRSVRELVGRSSGSATPPPPPPRCRTGAGHRQCRPIPPVPRLPSAPFRSSCRLSITACQVQDGGQHQAQRTYRADTGEEAGRGCPAIDNAGGADKGAQEEARRPKAPCRDHAVLEAYLPAATRRSALAA